MRACLFRSCIFPHQDPSVAEAGAARETKAWSVAAVPRPGSLPTPVSAAAAAASAAAGGGGGGDSDDSLAAAVGRAGTMEGNGFLSGRTTSAAALGESTSACAE